MRGYAGIAVSLILALSTPSQANPLGYSKQDGRTRLDGSSFGVLGINKTFDYIVVGGGTAGLTIASRLAANPALSVAVIEAGGFYEQNNGNISQVPAFAVQYSSASPSSIQPFVDWGIVSLPQPQLNGREIHYTQGKCLGGGGTAGTYQAWADLVGDPSYTFNNTLPYFKKSTNFTPPNYDKRGPDSAVSYFNYYMPFSPYVKKALQAEGIPEIAGANNGQLLGFAETTATLDPAAEVRSSSESSFLQQAIRETTLQVYHYTLANEIIFDSQEDKKRATGVRVTTAGSTYTLSARREIILSAGVFRSPQLLMVSGIGPAETLQALDIPVVADLPGDHPFFDTTFRVSIPTQTQLTSNATFLALATEEYLAQQKGPLTASAGNYIGWEKLPAPHRRSLSNSTLHDLASIPADWPELQYVPVPAAVSAVNNNSSGNNNYMSMSVVLMAATSRGNVTINSTSTADNPLVHLGWLSTQTDQEMAVAGLKRARQLANATGLVVHDDDADGELLPGPAVQTDADILAYIQSEVRPIHHAVSSCAMGKPTDSNAVVDSHARVLGGVRGLRVVDASVFPLLPPGQIQATVYMLAEKIAAEILAGV
ncbi:hypothetical protein DV735_g4272, partial [Chaetothyriales sp. CBS 134920]